MRCKFSEALNQRSVAQTCAPNSRRRKIDDDARPQPRSKTLMPGCRSSADVSHSVSHSALAPPLTALRTQSGWYCEERGKRLETSSRSEFTWISLQSSIGRLPPLRTAIANRPTKGKVPSASQGKCGWQRHGSAEEGEYRDDANGSGHVKRVEVPICYGCDDRK
jgi:hypothetical protein